MRRDIAFNAEGTMLHGWLYVPEHTAVTKHPVIVMCKSLD